MWVPSHHGVSRPQVADTDDGLQIWKVDVNIFSKRSRIADKGWSSNLCVDQGIKFPRRKMSAYYDMLHRASDLDGFFGTI
jgi:hypothetical protein